MVDLVGWCIFANAFIEFLARMLVARKQLSL